MEQIKKFFKSFHFASKGGVEVFKERNFKIHLVIAFLVLVLGLVVRVSNLEFIILILTITFVLVAEVFNTVVERVCDIIRDYLGLDYAATKVPRDISALAVLITAISSIVVGLVIFIPRILQLISP